MVWSSFTAQNVGAEPSTVSKKDTKPGQDGTYGGSTILCSFFTPQRTDDLSVLDGSGTLAMSTGVQFLRIVAPFYFVASMKLMADGVLRGAGAMTLF